MLVCRSGAHLGCRLLWMGLLLVSSLAQAEVVQSGRWVKAPDDVRAIAPLDHGPAPERTGGEFWYELLVSVPRDGDWVLDFRSSMVIAEFDHWVLASDNSVVSQLRGGLQSELSDDFALRHGRQLSLPAGDYRVVSRLNSPYYLAVPEPQLFALSDYLHPARIMAVFTALGVGIFLALGFYYLVMGIWRRSASDILYVGFIIGNVLFFSTAAMLSKTVFGPVSFFWTSVPILFSNIVYVLFVMRLLSIGRVSAPRFYWLGCASVVVLAGFLVAGLLWPSWSLEMARFGVGVFAAYGVSAGVFRALQKQKVAYFYLLANLSFLGPAVMSISSKELAFSGIFTLEHLGLLAVLLEVLLLAHVMSYQVGLLHRKRMARVGMVEKVRLLSQLNHRIPGMVYQLERTKQGNLQVRYVSPGVRDLFGLTEADVKLSLTPLLERLHVDDRPQMQSSLAQSAEHMSMWELEFRVMLPRQGTRWLAALAHPERRPDGGVLWHGFMTDITARREAEDSLRHLAEHDPLTGCLNRASMEQMLVSDIAEASLKGQLLSVIMLDLDRFKPVNDRYGHRAGDRLLQVVAERIVAAIRNTDRVARLGGDEFVIILSRITSDADALTIAEKLRRSISQAIVIDEVALHTTASIGVAVFPDHGQNGDDLVEAADRAMYLAKKQGRDSVMLASK